MLESKLSVENEGGERMYKSTDKRCRLRGTEVKLEGER